MRPAKDIKSKVPACKTFRMELLPRIGLDHRRAVLSAVTGLHCNLYRCS